MIRTYRSRKGNPTFVYAVSCSPAELAEYKKAQGEFYREDEKTGNPLWFTTRCVGENGTLIITTNGKIVPDMSAFDQAASIAAQYGGNFGQELAKQAAMSILGHAPAPVEAPVEATAPVVDAPVVEAPVAEGDDETS